MQYIVKSPLGPLTVTVVNGHITSVVFGEKREREDLLGMDTNEKGECFDRLSMTGHIGLKRKIQKQLDDYFAGTLKVFDLPLHYQGTPFQMKVWKYLQSIPYGKTASYQTVAKAIGHPKSARAVGTACKRNPIPIIIPCHRVISATGAMGEYAGGKTRKTKLLRLEESTLSS